MGNAPLNCPPPSQQYNADDNNNKNAEDNDNLRLLHYQQQQQQQYHPPSRPFSAPSHHKRSSCVVRSFLLHTPSQQKKKQSMPLCSNSSATTTSPPPTIRTQSTLLMLILSQDWQRVLCRVALYPQELEQYERLFYLTPPPPQPSNSHANPQAAATTATAVEVLPLHLACALHPPLAVVALLLDLYVDALALPIRPSLSRRKSVSSSGRQRRRQPQPPPAAASMRMPVIANNSSAVAISKPPRKRRFHSWRRNHRHSEELSTILHNNSSSIERSDDTNNNQMNNKEDEEEEDEMEECINRRLIRRPDDFPCSDETSCGNEETDVPSVYITAIDDERFENRKGALDNGNVVDDENSSSSSISSSASIDKHFHETLQGNHHSSMLIDGESPLLQRKLIIGATSRSAGSNIMNNKSGSAAANPTKMQLLFRSMLESPFSDYDHVVAMIMSEDSNLLPLHICCLYSASSAVVQIVARLYPPAAAISSSDGMLPIHWVAAGWTLPPLFPPPPRFLFSVPRLLPDDPSSCSQPSGLPHTQTSSPARLSTMSHSQQQSQNEQHDHELLKVLSILRQTVPNSVHMRSDNHGMTPEDYIHECMEESDLKKSCMLMLQTDPLPTPVIVETNNTTIAKDEEDCDLSVSSSLYSIFGVSGDDCIEETSSNKDEGTAVGIASLSALVAASDWEGALEAIEDCPSMAARWIYGIDTYSSVVWKRLPLHMACEHPDTPIGLVSVLLQHYPDAATAVDPLYGSTPLHMACQAPASFHVVRLLLGKGPDAAQIVNVYGQVPLHLAVKGRARYDMIEALVAEFPQAVSVLDRDGMTPIDYAKAVYGENHIISELLTMILHYLNELSQNCVGSSINRT